MRVGRTDALQCDQCSQILAPPHAVIPLEDGRILHFCGLECLSDYFNLTGPLVERYERENRRTINQWCKVVCPACCTRLKREGL
jgi:hypothetical protein